MEPKDLIEKLFLKYQAQDGRVDAFGLHKILDEAKWEGKPAPCRSQLGFL